MSLKQTLVAATMAVAAFGAALSGHDECANIAPSEELLAAAAQMAAHEAEAAKSPNKKPAAEVNVPVYIHVIASSQSKSDGYLSV